jgi:hypothetical protein
MWQIVVCLLVIPIQMTDPDTGELFITGQQSEILMQAMP